MNNFINYSYIALGGALGAVLRVFLSKIFNFNFVLYNISFPMGILLVNILGCFTIGLVSEVMGVYISANYNIRLFLISGFLGAFTTFSAFSLEFAYLWQKGEYLSSSIYAIVSFIFSIMAFFIAVKIVKIIL